MKFVQPQEVNGKELTSILSDLFNQTVKIHFKGPSDHHPIILLNGVKNILGDNREKPSQLLLDFTHDYIHSFPDRKDDETKWSDFTSQKNGLTVFTDEVELAVMERQRKRAEGEIAKQISASHHSMAILELLAELAFHNMNELGLFTFHWLRSFYFHQDVQLLWPYSICMLSEIFKARLTPVQEVIHYPPDKILPKVLDPLHLPILPLFSVTCRLWDGDYVRIKSFKKAISGWCSNQNINPTTGGSTSYADIVNYIQNGGTYFIDLGERIIRTFYQNEAINKMIQLEALRGLVKISGQESLPQIANCINFVMK